MKRKEIRVRCWVNVDGQRFFGPGPAELLRLIEATGSISRAARTMGMSYKKAWDIVDNLNTRARKAFVIAHKGGQRGGGAQLTDTGRKALVAYEKLAGKIEKIVRAEKALLQFV
ncbi:MAG TPA: ModE family transcriptional regulator [Cyclobacteriaceae bacterium]